jgi:Raf kinase inhibitor-like YbhB/YbcL family protein
VACSLLAALAACSSSDGRTLPPPDSHRTTTSVSTPVVGQPSDGGVVEVFSLFSGAFVDGGAIPARYTCAGEGVSPPLSWTAVPAAAELALVVRDPDAGGFVHWVVTGIDPAALGFGEGGVPESAVEAANQGGQLGWTGPCPPQGDGPHRYVFTLHALPEPLDLAPGTPGPDAAALVEGASSDAASVTGTFSR